MSRGPNTHNETGVSRQVGTVSDIDERAGRVRVRLPEYGNLRSPWLDVLQRKTQDDKDYWMPDIGEQVAVLLDLSGDEGWVLGALYSEVDQPPVASRDKWHRRFKDGAMIEYDRAEHAFRLELPAGGKVLIVAPTGVLVQTDEATLDAKTTVCKGDLVVEGRLTYLGGMSGKPGPGGGKAADIEGDIGVNGNMDVSGTVMDGGGNSNHHRH
ncbi:phage baseplate assembly protein V [Cupriavidus metallidurans]|uniref:Phage baseplate assembly protein V n=1 Tax=Cupriavidus metallidurans TaxID=119219 RepID=A0A482IM78_9BURK|nr:phage baseplate assembly protein V [Cupriavidus metallidurans]QBP09858.1 phage baseplate assembly protein V [Cupriavidus metallidurans]